MIKHTAAGRPAKKNAKLSKDRILILALQLIEEGGAKAVSYRALAKILGVTPMAVSHHVGNHKMMLGSLIALGFKGVGSEPEGATPLDRLRFLLARYCDSILKHPELIKCALADPSLIEGELRLLTNLIRLNAAQSDSGDEHDTLLNLLVDYTHGFALSVSAATGSGQLSAADYLRGLDWILGRVEG